MLFHYEEGLERKCELFCHRCEDFSEFRTRPWGVIARANHCGEEHPGPSSLFRGGASKVSAGLKQIRRCPQVFFHLEDRKFVVRQGAETASGTHGQMDEANLTRHIAPTHPCTRTRYRLDSMTPPLTWQYRLRHNGGSISLRSSVYGWNVMSRPGQVFRLLDFWCYAMWDCELSCCRYLRVTWGAGRPRPNLLLEQPIW